MSRSKRVACAVVTTLVTVTGVVFHLTHRPGQSHLLLTFYLLDLMVIVFYMAAFTRGRAFTHLPVAAGRIIAVVPTFNDDTDLLHNCVRSLINQTRPPDEIHVVDDGSAVPVVTFEHPLVTWHRQPNQGKRFAQGNLWAKLHPKSADFILTTDGDSVLDEHAVEHLLRAMSNPRVQAATGLILVRNYAENLLTRVADLNIGTSCLMIRTSRSVIGAVETTSGALAMYRAAVIFDNLDDYVSSGTNGDDRRLTLYALLRGEVVVVNEAIVHSAMPGSVRDTYRQRLRWGKSGWQAIPFSVTNLSGKQLFFPVLSLFEWVTLPLIWGWALYSMARWGGGGHAALAFAVYLAIRYGEVGLYMISRPNMGPWTKLWMWLLLTPAERIINMLVIRPSKYHALFKLKQRGWETRGNAHSDDLVEVSPSRGPQRYRSNFEPPSTALSASLAQRDRARIPHRRDGDDSSTLNIPPGRLADLLRQTSRP